MGTRATIGLFVADIEDVFCKAVCRGAFSAAVEEDVNLFVFPGKYLQPPCPKDCEQIYEYQHNSLFSYGFKECMDLAVVCTGSILSRIDNSKIKSEFLERFGEVPVLSVSSREEFGSYIKYESKTGIRDAINYLCKEKRCCTIAFTAGSKMNDDTSERLNAYQETLMENGLLVDSELIAFGNFASCEECTQDLLRRRPDVEAIICGSDAMAEDVYKAVRSVGRTVGRDIYVVGFGDAEKAMKMRPPLAFISADASLLGYQAIQTACRMLREKKKIQAVLKTKFVPQESVGFLPYELHGGLNFLQDLLAKNVDLKFISNNVTDFIFVEHVWDFQAEYRKKLLCTFFQKLLDRYFDGLMKRSSAEDLYVQFRNMISRGMLKHVEPKCLFRLFDILYQIFCIQNKTMTERLEFHNLLDKFLQCVVDEMTADDYETKREREYMYRIMNQIEKDILMFSGETEDGYLNALAKLSELGIKKEYLYIWEEPKEHRCEEEWHVPESVLLKVYQQNGEFFKLSRTKQKMQTREYAKNPYFDCKERFTYLVVDFYFKASQFGFMICDLSYENLCCVEFITNQLSLMVNADLLSKHQSEVRKKLEEK